MIGGRDVRLPQEGRPVRAMRDLAAPALLRLRGHPPRNYRHPRTGGDLRRLAPRSRGFMTRDLLRFRGSCWRACACGRATTDAPITL